MTRLQSLIQLCKYILRDLPLIQKLEETKRGETTFLSLQQLSLKPLPYFKENPEKRFVKTRIHAKHVQENFPVPPLKNSSLRRSFVQVWSRQCICDSPPNKLPMRPWRSCSHFSNLFKLDQVTVQISSLYFCLHGLRRGRKGKFSLLTRFPYQ